MSNTPNSLLSSKNLSLGRALVKISANWCKVSTYSIWQSPFWIWSLRKWCLISICLVLECIIGFLVKFIALVLSHFRGILSRKMSKSSSYCFIHKIWAQQFPAAIYSTSVVDKATHACFFECHDTKEQPKKWQVPLVLFLSILQPP